MPVINNLLALNKATGVKKWVFPTGPPVGGVGAGTSGAPAVSTVDGTIFYSGQDGHVYAIDPTCGTQKWKFSIGAQSLSMPSVSLDGTKLFVHAVTKLYTLNPNTGAKIWEADVPGGGMVVPAVTSTGAVLVMNGSGVVYSFDAATGSQNWSFNSGNPNSLSQGMAIAQTAGGDVLYFTASAATQKLFAIKASDGTKLWDYAVPATSNIGFSAPIIGGSGNIYLRALDGKVFSIK